MSHPRLRILRSILSARRRAVEAQLRRTVGEGLRLHQSLSENELHTHSLCSVMMASTQLELARRSQGLESETFLPSCSASALTFAPKNQSFCGALIQDLSLVQARLIEESQRLARDQQLQIRTLDLVKSHQEVVHERIRLKRRQRQARIDWLESSESGEG